MPANPDGRRSLRSATPAGSRPPAGLPVKGEVRSCRWRVARPWRHHVRCAVRRLADRRRRAAHNPRATALAFIAQMHVGPRMLFERAALRRIGEKHDRLHVRRSLAAARHFSLERGGQLASLAIGEEERVVLNDGTACVRPRPAVRVTRHLPGWLLISTTKTCRIPTSNRSISLMLPSSAMNSQLLNARNGSRSGMRRRRYSNASRSHANGDTESSCPRWVIGERDLRSGPA